MAKSLGASLHLWGLFHYNVGHAYTLLLQSFNIVLGSWGGGGEATHFKTDNSTILKLGFKNTEN